jgi:ATP-dependent Lhr-like helicase
LEGPSTISPLRALSNDVQKNLQRPLRSCARWTGIAGDPRAGAHRRHPARDRAAMLRKPPHMLVTTPESLYILLTSRRARDAAHGARRSSSTRSTRWRATSAARTCRCRSSARSAGRPFQRIGLSATQKPLSEVAKFLVGVGRECDLVDVGHKRAMDVAIVVPPSPLSTVCSHEQWDEIYQQIAR